MCPHTQKEGSFDVGNYAFTNNRYLKNVVTETESSEYVQNDQDLNMANTDRKLVPRIDDINSSDKTNFLIVLVHISLFSSIACQSIQTTFYQFTLLAQLSHN